MEQQKYYLSKNGSNVGPFMFNDVLKRLEKQEHQWMDYVFDEAQQDWIMLMEHPHFTEKFNQGFARPKAKPIPALHHADKVAELRPESRFREKAWFLLRDGNNYGPFSVMDLVQMLQEKSLFEYDYVWMHGMSAWKRVADVPEFAKDKMRSMHGAKDSEVSEMFFRRRHARANYGCSLIVHDNKTVLRGHSMEISEGGAGVVIERTDLNPGQTLYLHFQPGDGVPPFNAVCSIVSKQWVKDAPNGSTPVRYGVKFTSISQSVREQIRDYAEKKKAG